MSEPNEEPSPFFRYPRPYPRSGQASRAEAHEQRIAGHVQRHRERGAQPPRRDRGLSRDEIVRTAIAIADAEGPDAISMRRIARELSAGAMSLYWYVGSKEELLELMLDAIEAEIEVPEPSGDWRADLGAFAHRDQGGVEPAPVGRRIHRHQASFRAERRAEPGAPARPARRDGRRRYSRDHGNLHDGRHLRDRRGGTRGAGDTVPARAGAGRGGSNGGGDPGRARAVPQVVRGLWSFPADRPSHGSGLDPDDPNTRDERFQFSLDCVLDGIAVRLGSQIQ